MSPASGRAVDTIQLAKPVIGDREVELVEQVLRSGQLSLGPMLRRFEQAWAERAGVAHAVACSSGTAGLHACFHAMGLGPGDEVIVPSFSFVASANAILFTGATPVFAEVDPLTFNLDPAAVEAAITPRTRAIEIVDIFGYPAELPVLVDIARRHGLAIVEDACQAIGGDYNGRPYGTWGHPAVLAFYANKQMTTGEGGVILTDDDELARVAESLVNQGRSDDGAWLVHSRLGFNYRLSDVHAAIGVAQLERLDGMLADRERVAGWYQARVAAIDGVRPMFEGPQRRSWFVYAPRLDAGIDRNDLIARLESVGIQSKPYLPCIHLQPYYQKVHGYRPGLLPVTEAISASTIALPFFPQMTEDQVERVCSELAAAIAEQRARA
jgi:perosamine synthetase